MTPEEIVKKVILSKEAPAPIGPYSQAVESQGFVFCSGQIPLDPVSGEMVTGDIKLQAEMVMKNIDGLLRGAGLHFDHIVKSTIFLTNMADFAVVNEVYGRYFKQNPPARSTIAVAALPKGAQVEIEVLAHR
jgi:2-iminobutanoate/2-iminopropanoate deaminase